MMKASLLFILLMTALACNARAQSQIGIELGEGWHKQRGDVYVVCGCIPSVPAKGSNYILGALYESDMFFALRSGIKFRYDQKQTSGRLEAHSEAVIIRFPNDSVAVEKLDFRRETEIETSYLTFAPYVAYKIPFFGFVLQAGPSISYLTSSYVTHDRYLLNNLLDYPDGTDLGGLRYKRGESNTQSILAGPIKDIKKWRFAALLSAGFEFESFGVAFAPLVTYDIPLNTIRDQEANDWMISSIYGSLAVKVGL
jgi:hypothetical protein